MTKGKRRSRWEDDECVIIDMNFIKRPVLMTESPPVKNVQLGLSNRKILKTWRLSVRTSHSQTCFDFIKPEISVSDTKIL